MTLSLTSVGAPARFHLSLNVTDLKRSVAFYRVLFGMEPAKLHDDYAKFDLVDPPVVFSLVPHSLGPGTSLSHAGLRVADAAAIEKVQQRLEAAGIPTQTQECTVCGYAKQSKLWLVDPDGTHWEVYVVEEDVDPAAVRRTLEGAAARLELPPGPIVWEHYLTHPWPDRIPHEDDSVDEVRLVGTFNSSGEAEQCQALVAEAWRVLRPGGKVLTHGLMGDRPFPGAAPKLPGLAAMVARVPVQDEPLRAFESAGFVGIQFVKFTEVPWFVHDGVELREVKLIGWKPGLGEEQREVLYKGPFLEAVDESGRIYPRGRRVTVSASTWDLLRQGAAAEQFLFFQPDAIPGACS